MKYAFILVLAAFSATANATLPGPKTGIGLASLRDTDEYRLGDEWGKKPVTAETLTKETPTFQRAALATAHVGGATGFYLGKFHGAHVMATNHHVYEREWNCTGRTVSFPLQGVTTKCESLLGSWPEIDLALFIVRLSPEDEAKLAPAAGNFRFNQDVSPGERLLTIGFGLADNPQREMVANEDNDCYVFSGQAEYRQLADPDSMNPANYRAWSFAFGCDVSHGDSGSAIVDRDTGALVGILWTGRTPKSSAAQSSANLTRMFQGHEEAIWQELSYAVPARKMGEVLREQLTRGGLKEESKAILADLLQ